MTTSTAELTVQYIKEHPHIQSCLKKNLINYSALSREIATELSIKNKTSLEAILIAARRYKEKLKSNKEEENTIIQLLKESELEIKNKVSVLTLRKISDEQINNIINKLHQASATFFLVKGSEHYTLILQAKDVKEINKKSFNILNEKKELSMIILKSAQRIERTKGVVAYLTNLFSENGINIIEFSSSWTDTLFIINSKDIHKAMDFLEW